YQPLDGGKPSAMTDRREPWRAPWQPAGDEESVRRWSRVNGAGKDVGETDPTGLTWRFRGGGGAQPGTLAFQFTPDIAQHFYPYNQKSGHEYIEDMRIAATVTPASQAVRL